VLAESLARGGLIGSREGSPIAFVESASTRYSLELTRFCLLSQQCLFTIDKIAGDDPRGVLEAVNAFDPYRTDKQTLLETDWASEIAKPGAAL